MSFDQTCREGCIMSPVTVQCDYVANPLSAKMVEARNECCPQSSAGTEANDLGAASCSYDAGIVDAAVIHDQYAIGNRLCFANNGFDSGRFIERRYEYGTAVRDRLCDHAARSVT
jgi:hypothetical protein